MFLFVFFITLSDLQVNNHLVMDIISSTILILAEYSTAEMPLNVVVALSALVSLALPQAVWQIFKQDLGSCRIFLNSKALPLVRFLTGHRADLEDD